MAIDSKLQSRIFNHHHNLNKMRYLITICLMSLFVMSAQSQTVRRFHQNFDVEEIESIDIQVKGNVQVNTWAGNTILVEVNITTANGSAAVLNMLQKEGRYDLDLKKNGLSGQVENKMTHQQNIKVKGVEMDETIEYTISIPDSFRAENVEVMRNFKKVI